MSQASGLMQGKRDDALSLEQVGACALALLSGMSRGVIGEVHHADPGCPIVGMRHPGAADISKTAE